MSGIRTLSSNRLLLRDWRESDREPFAALNADPEVMACLPGLLTRAQSDEMLERIQAHFDEHGFGLWAVEVRGTAPLIGYVGLNVPTFQAHFTPCVEIGWRLARSMWGHGYATEGAAAVLDLAFGELGLAEVVAFTVLGNTRSRAVMERLGMTHDSADDFAHPSLPPEHPLSRHVLYRISAHQWRARTAGPT